MKEKEEGWFLIFSWVDGNYSEGHMDQVFKSHGSHVRVTLIRLNFQVAWGCYQFVNRG